MFCDFLTAALTVASSRRHTESASSPTRKYTLTTTTIFRLTDLKIGASESSHRALHSDPNEIPRFFFNMPESALQRLRARRRKREREKQRARQQLLVAIAGLCMVLLAMVIKHFQRHRIAAYLAERGKQKATRVQPYPPPIRYTPCQFAIDLYGWDDVDCKEYLRWVPVGPCGKR
jgi:hypothetical protein